MKRRDFLRLAAGAAALPAMPHLASAQAGYPNRLVRLVVGFPAAAAQTRCRASSPPGCRN